MTRSVLIAHDYLTQVGGAERVALELAKRYRPREVITSAYDPARTFEEFVGFTVRASWLSRVSAFRADVRRALPLLPLVWRMTAPAEADVVICSSSGWSHRLRVAPGTRKVVYCHNPARWIYQPEDYMLDQSRATRLVMRLLRPWLRRGDQNAAATADLYVANSTSVARRVSDAYGIEARVIHPPVALDVEGDQVPVEGVQPGYFLSVGRPRGYKGAEALIGAFEGLPNHRLVLVGGAMEGPMPTNAVALGRVTESELRWLYSNARALISVSSEDFGLTPIEANAFGTPVLLLKRGGFLDSTDEGVSGMFIEDVTIDAIRAAVDSFPVVWDVEAIIRHADKFSPASFARQLDEAIWSGSTAGSSGGVGPETNRREEEEPNG